MNTTKATLYQTLFTRCFLFNLCLLVLLPFFVFHVDTYECNTGQNLKLSAKEQRLDDDPFEITNQCIGVQGISCADMYKKGARADGVYRIEPDGLGEFNVRCDMTTNDGGWTVFQRRINGSVDFYLDWNDYKRGFGDLNDEFWLGLDKIHRLSKSGQNVLRVDLEDFEDKKNHAQYSTFEVANGADKYNLTVGGYSGSAGDSLARENGMKFSTKDVDNDVSGKNCAVEYKGAWWYQNCHYSNLNGLYLRGVHSSQGVGVTWYHLKGSYYSLKKTEMKIRPRSF